jgi:threonine/homoserine/homoserine lactone efflux protein
MPSTQTLLIFALVAIGFVAIPGPSNLFVLGRGLSSGARPAIAAAAGCATGAMTYVAATAAGLSALIASSQLVFAALHYAGAAYLVWLGIKAWRNGEAEAAPAEADAPKPRASGRSVYLRSVVTGVLNPKVALFFLALFPQFVHRAAGPPALQILVLGAIFVTAGFASDCMYAVGSGRLRAWLMKRPERLPRQQRATGALYVGLGVWAALAGTGRER